MDLKSEVKCRCLLRQIDGLTFGRIHHDVVIIEGCHHILDEATIFHVKLHILQYPAEAVNPTAYVAFLPFCHDTYLVVANHPLAGDMHLFPTSVI